VGRFADLFRRDPVSKCVDGFSRDASGSPELYGREVSEKHSFVHPSPAHSEAVGNFLNGQKKRFVWHTSIIESDRGNPM
jgi:hypothetical protein